MQCRPRPGRHCGCDAEVFSESSLCAPRNSPESVRENGGSRLAKYPGQSRASRDGNIGAKDPDADQSAEFRPREWVATRRWLLTPPVHRHPECAEVLGGRPRHSVSKAIRAMAGTRDSSASSAGGGSGDAAPACAEWRGGGSRQKGVAGAAPKKQKTKGRWA